MPRGALQPVHRGHGGGGYPRDHLQLHHEVRRGHPQRPVLQHRPLRRYHHVPGCRRSHVQRDHRAGAVIHEDQGCRAPRAQVLRVDRRFHPRVALHLPADVDRQVRVRRVRSLHRPPQVLLKTF